MREKPDFLGRGWAFPVLPSDGRLLMAAGAQDIAQAIRIILQTAPGERVMLPAFGCRLNELVFAAPNASTTSLAELYVKQALDSWEPRIQLSAVHASLQSAQLNCLYISMDYLILSHNQPDNLVYPFFLK